MAETQMTDSEKIEKLKAHLEIAMRIESITQNDPGVTGYWKDFINKFADFLEEQNITTFSSGIVGNDYPNRKIFITDLSNFINLLEKGEASLYISAPED